ncbi:potassium channel family protein [Novipirellula artificiosorum]|uniref:Voltage-gated potassium channel n=1 Tax=Novipirellula artificiosorum TaxID=2528016 RepID=A0A5C6D263_9BACT|nr:potassium channel family protein [Novipirellula artificiosorum]TWU30828.1 voltage-gated potassium channel [Novipirellula artificiosorum]
MPHPHRNRRLQNFVTFSRYMFRYAGYIREVLAGLLLLILLCGVAISHIERLSLGEALYFSFITGLSIGYGDITPVTPLGRVLCVFVGLIGTVFTGLVVAIATRALAQATSFRWEQREHDEE